MSWTKEITLWCDGKNGDCVNWIQLGARNVTACRETAESHGWLYISGKDICPKCRHPPTEQGEGDE